MAPPITERVEDLQPYVQGKALVLIDGRNGVGKSTLARDLAVRLRGTYVEADCFFESPWGRDTSQIVYPDVLDLEALRVRVVNALKRGPVVFDGLCIRDVARRMGLNPDAHVLVSAIDPAVARFTLGRSLLFDRRLGNVVDAALLDDSVALGDLLVAMADERPGVNDVNQRSIVRYFKTDRPHRVAHVVYVPRR